jgi:hypothetical protein
MAKRIERIDIAQNDVFEGIKESAKKAEMEVDLLAKALKLVNQGIDDVKGKAKGMQSNPIPTDVKGIKEQNQLQKDALALAKERERLEKLKIQTAQQSTKAEADAIRLQSLKNKELEKSEARLRKEAKAQADANSAYTKASNRLNELRKSYKDLAVAGNENSTEARKMKREIDSLDKTLKRVDGNVGQFQRNVGNYSSAFSKMGGVLRSTMGLLGVGLGASALKNLITESIELSRVQEKAVAQVQAGLISTNNAVGFSLDELKAKASGFQKNTLFGDEQILTDLTSVMLTFTNVTGESFDRAQQSALDLSTRMQGDLKGAAVQLGKALNDPIKGVTALTKVGVSFTEEQKNQIKTLTESGKLMDAQNIILDEMNRQFGGSAVAAAEADGGIQQMKNALGDAKEEFGKVVLEGLKPFIKSMKEFFESITADDIRAYIKTLGTVFNVVLKLTKAYIAYRVVLITINTYNKIASTNFRDLAKSMTSSGGQATKFGSALKGIGWTVAIALAVELGMKLWDIASGAEQSRANLARLQAQADKALKTGGEQVDKIMGKYNIRIEELNNQLKARKITQADYLKLLKVEQEVAVSGLKSYIQNANARRKGYEEDKKFLESFLAVNGQILGVGDEQRKRFKEIFKDTGIKDFTDSFGKITAQARMDAMAQLDANINGVNIKLKQYNEEMRKAGSESASTKAEIEGLSKETKQNTKSTEKDTKAIKEKTKAYKDAKTVIDELIAKQKEYDDANLAQQDELDEGLVSAQRTNLDFELDAQERELQAVRDKYRRLEDLAIEFGYGQEELLEARLNEENEIRTKYAQDELKSEEEKQAKLLEEEKKALDERRNMRKELVDNVINEMKRISTEEEKLIDDRIKAEQDLQSNLQAQASAGNISAQQSIVASMEAEKRATLEKQKEQRKQQALDDIKTLYNLINSNISNGDGVGIATTKAIASMGVIKSVAKVFSALTGFAKGTEWRLGDEHKPMFGGVDGHVVRVDSSEAIVKGSLMDKAERAGITSTSELVQLAVSQKLQPNMYAMNDDRLNYVPVAVKQNNDLSELKRELRDIKDTIKNKTEFSIDPYVLNGMVKGIVETQKTGNFSRKNIFK